MINYAKKQKNNKIAKNANCKMDKQNKLFLDNDRNNKIIKEQKCN